MERTKRTFKAALASLLVAMLLALGALAGVGATANGGFLAGLSSSTSATTTTQQAIANDTSIVSGTNSSGIEQTSVTTQAGAALDARDVVKAVGPAVVTVVNTMQTTVPGRFGQGRTQTSEALGSGIIISSEGYIITNQHVVDGQVSLKVIYADGTEVAATLVGADAYTDIAVIKVEGKVPAVAQFGDSDALEPGQPVIAIGTALGDYSNTVTEGIISGLHRQIDGGGTSTQDMVQTDAAINHGNSGGPLLDLSGKVIGINTAIVRTDSAQGDIAEGLGFAIPSNTARKIAGELIKNGAVNHPYLGVSYQTITPQMATAENLARQQGIYVGAVAAGSPADKAGIQVGTIITKIDGVEVGTGDNYTLVGLLSKYNVGDSVTLTIVAPGSTNETQVKVVLGAQPAN